ncbi:quinic acid utilization activator [Aspergillus udagawae]|nr:quinic acid utilization activator [Aspergillus udagawae]
MPDSRPSKRQRISRACDQCRRRKSKCDGAQPVCFICHAAGRSCTYHPSGRRRGLQSGYVGALQAILGIVLEHVPNSETTVKAILRDTAPGDDFLGSDLSERYIAVWRGSKLSRETMQILDPSMTKISDDEELVPELEPELVLEPTNTPVSADPMWTPSNLSNRQEHPPQSKSLSVNKASDIAAWPLPENIVQIVEYYFSHVHSWFPILERRDILRSMHSDPSTPDDPISGHRITLWTIILYVSIAQDGPNPERYACRAQIQSFLQSRVLEDSDTLQHSHVEALLVLVLLDIGIGNLSKAWVELGQVERLLAILPVSAREARYGRTHRGCCFLDTIVSALTGQTPGLSGEIQNEDDPIDENGLDEWDVWVPFLWEQNRMHGLAKKGPLRALSAFNLSSQLAQHLARVLHFQPARDNADRLMADLQHWKLTLASRYPVSSSHNPALLTLHLASEFVTLRIACKIHPLDSSMVASMKASVRSTLHLLNLYIEIAGTTRTSPLLRWFLHQPEWASRLVDMTDDNSPQDQLLNQLAEMRLALDWTSSSGCSSKDSGPIHLDDPRVQDAAGAGSQQVRTPTNDGRDIFESSTSRRQARLDEMNSAPVYTPCQTHESDGCRSFDAVLEELATSVMPTENAPSFAHNLGFCAGDIDSEFLDSLRYLDHE